MAPIYNKSLKQMMFYVVVWFMEVVEGMLFKPVQVKK